jgi:pimeloyl-ACP methyl ester carboxylesterase
VATFVLVHGAWAGAWCWRDVAPLLRAEGHRVLAPDLPGHGEDRAPVAEMTLEAYARRVQETVEAAPEPVVLVGHSMGGMVVTQAAEHVPDRIARLVYLAAFLPADGQTLPQLAASFEGADRVQPNVVVDERAGTCVVAPAALVDVFFGECSEEDAAFAISRLVPESLAAIAAPVRVTPERAGRVPRAYIECLRDGAITLPLQRHMHAALPCDPVLALDADHSPYFSRPRELVAHLLALAR